MIQIETVIAILSTGWTFSGILNFVLILWLKKTTTKVADFQGEIERLSANYFNECEKTRRIQNEISEKQKARNKFNERIKELHDQMF